MTLNKLTEWITARKVAKAMASGAAAFAVGTVGGAVIDDIIEPDVAIISEAHADFYDGCRAPEEFQIDQRLSLGDWGYTLLPKVFVDRDDDGNGLFGVMPVGYGGSGFAGVGVGGFFDLGRVSLLGVVPVVYNIDGEVLNVNPTLYATIQAGNLLLDPRVSYLASISGDGVSHRINVGGTLGVVIDNVTLGIDAELSINPENVSGDTLREGFSYQGIVRVNLDDGPRNWLQLYVSPDAVRIGFRANFGL